MRVQTLNSSRMHDGISKAHIERFSEFHVLFFLEWGYWDPRSLDRVLRLTVQCVS